MLHVGPGGGGRDMIQQTGEKRGNKKRPHARKTLINYLKKIK